MVGRRPRKKRSIALSMFFCCQVARIDLSSTGYAIDIEVRKEKMGVFLQKWLFTNNSWTAKARDVSWVPLCSPRRDASKYMHADIKDQCQTLTLGQGHVRSRDEPSRSCCISVDASTRVKHTGAIPLPSALSLIYQSHRQKRIWPHMTSDDPKERLLGQHSIWVAERDLM